MTRQLVLILGDQLDRQSPVFEAFDPNQDRILMAEVDEESRHVWSHQQRIAVFLSAMRRFAAELEQKNYPLSYYRLGEHPFESLGELLGDIIRKECPSSIIAVWPGDYRVKQQLDQKASEHQLSINWLDDSHFISSPSEFSQWAKGRKELRLEHWYRHLRKRHGILMEGADKQEPAGGAWNFDKKNRKSFGKQGPGLIAAPLTFEQDDIIKDVLRLVKERFNAHPGSLETFNWPTTPAQAEDQLDDFITQHLPLFGRYQDAMWTDEAFLHHSRLSVALNLKLLHPRQVIERAQQAYQRGDAPIESVEGFIRQLLGWREYVRGLYWLYMPDWVSANSLNASQTLPAFYWSGDTDMQCLKQAIGQTLEYGYAHHIQRLMVTGLFAQLLGVKPKAVHEWYLAVYVDAVEWVELPNTLGMSQFADGGLMASKPYVASGKYIQRMSNYCHHCPFDPAQSVGEDACPFTTLYWDFLARHQARFSKHPRTALQWKHLEKLTKADRQAIQAQAHRLRQTLCHQS